MLLAHEFLLLALQADTGKPQVPTQQLDAALGGAFLVDLVMRERLQVTSDEGPRSQRGRLHIMLNTPTGEQLLDDVLLELTTWEGKRVKDVVTRWVSKRTVRPWREQLLADLVDAGAVHVAQRKFLGLFTTTTYPETDPRIERDVRIRVDAALIGAQRPADRTAALISLLYATKLLRKVLSDETDRRAAERRAKQIAENEWAGRAVKKALDEIAAAAIGAGAAVIVVAGS